MGARHKQAGAREPGLVGIHEKTCQPSLGTIFLKEDFLEVVTLAPKSRRVGRIARKDKEGIPHGGRVDHGGSCKAFGTGGEGMAGSG